MTVKVSMTNNFKPTLNIPDLENSASALESPSQTTSKNKVVVSLHLNVELI